MGYFEALKIEKSNISRVFYYAFRKSFIYTWRNSTAPPTEPDFIANFVLRAIPWIARRIRNTFLGHNIRMSLYSVYCHQKPYVKFSGLVNKKYIELGDLLFIHFHKEHGKTVLRNGLLFQAKMCNSLPHHISTVELNQLNLYSKWPDFEYVNFGGLSGKKRSITPKMVNSGSQYLLLDKNKPSNYRSPGTIILNSAMPERNLVTVSTLHNTLFQFLYYTTGRTFDSYKNSTDNWDKVMWDLLISSRYNVFTRQNAGIITEPRFSGDSILSMHKGHYFMMDGYWSEDKPKDTIGWLIDDEHTPSQFETIVSEALDEDEPRGISTVFLLTDDRNEVLHANK